MSKLVPSLLPSGHRRLAGADIVSREASRLRRNSIIVLGSPHAKALFGSGRNCSAEPASRHFSNQEALFRIVLAVLIHRRALLNERRHALRTVLQCEGSVEQVAFDV